MKIAEGLYVLELYRDSMRAVTALHPALIWDEETVILFDAGLPGQFKSIREQINEAGTPFEKLSKVIITHQDIDHIGSLANIVKELGNKVEVLAHEEERPYIQGDKMPIKLTDPPKKQAKGQTFGMSEERRNAIKEMIVNLKTRVDTVVQDGEKLPYCGGIVAIHTPGHTPGHTCYYLKRYKTLVTGDAFNASEGKLLGPNPVFTYDMDEAVSSLKKLLQYDIENIICYHGGIVNTDAKKQIAELADSEI